MKDSEGTVRSHCQTPLLYSAAYTHSMCTLPKTPTPPLATEIILFLQCQVNVSSSSLLSYFFLYKRSLIIISLSILSTVYVNTGPLDRQRTVLGSPCKCLMPYNACWVNTKQITFTLCMSDLGHAFSCEPLRACFGHERKKKNTGNGSITPKNHFRQGCVLAPIPAPSECLAYYSALSWTTHRGIHFRLSNLWRILITHLS